MTIAKWLKNVDPVGLMARIFDGDEEIFCGSIFNIPYGYTQAKIGVREKGVDNYPIYFVDRLGGESSYADRAGVIINII